MSTSASRGPEGELERGRPRRQGRRGVRALLVWLLAGSAALLAAACGSARTGGPGATTAPDGLEAGDVAGRWASGPSLTVAAQGRRAYVGAGPILRVADVSDPSDPTVEGRTLLPGPVRDVAVSGARAYALYGDGEGLAVVDVSDPTAPRVSGTLEDGVEAWSAVVSGGRVHLAGDSTVRVVGVSGADEPRVLGRVAFEAEVVDLAVSDGRAFVLTGTPGTADGRRLVVMDLSDPERPARLALVEVTGSPEGIALAGRHLYVGGRTRGRVLDVSDPSNPREVGTVEGDGSSGLSDPVVAEGYLYSAGSGLSVFDLADPADPRPVGRASAPRARQLAVAEGRAYLAVGEAGLQVLDVSDPGEPRSFGTAALGRQPRDVAVADGRAVVADMLFGLFVFDVSDPALPSRLTSDPLQGAGGHAVGVEDGRAFVASGSRLAVVDLSASGGPRVLGTVETGGRRLAVAGDRVYVGGAGVLNAVEVSDPASPRIVGSAQPGGRVAALGVRGGHLYVATSDSLLVFDVSDRGDPVRSGATPVGSSAERAVAIAGGVAYVGGARQVHVVDVSDPARPRTVDRLPFPARTLAVAGDRLYVAAEPAGLRVLDVGDPSAPRPLGAMGSRGRIRRVATAGEHVYLIEGGSLTAVDVAEPTRPERVGTLEAGGPTVAVAARGDHAYAFTERMGRVLDVSDPSRPRSVGTLDPGVPRSYREMPTTDSLGLARHSTGFDVVDLATPTRPRIVAHPDVGGDGLALLGNRVYTAGNEVSVVDLSDPSEPEVLGSYGRRGVLYSDVGAAGDFAYALSGDRLEVLDVSRPAEPRLVDSLPVGQDTVELSPGPSDVVVRDGHAFVNGGGRLHVFDLSEPARPRPVTALRTGPSWRVVPGRRHLYLISGSNDVLRAVDVSDPVDPRPAGSFDPAGSIWAVAAADGRVYVAIRQGGLWILEPDG